MRLFIAIELDKEVKNYLYNLQQDLKKIPAKIKWTDKKGLHLTLKFLGEVDDEKLEKIKDNLSRIEYEKFSLMIDKLGVFPSENNARVIWVGIVFDKNVLELQKIIDANLLSLFPGDERFHSHITLGRIKFIQDKSKFKEFLKTNVEHKQFDVNEFKLMKSELSKEGARYSDVEVYRLE